MTDGSDTAGGLWHATARQPLSRARAERAVLIDGLRAQPEYVKELMTKIGEDSYARIAEELGLDTESHRRRTQAATDKPPVRDCRYVAALVRHLPHDGRGE